MIHSIQCFGGIVLRRFVSGFALVVVCLAAIGAEEIRWLERAPGLAQSRVIDAGPIVYSVARIEFSRKDFAYTTTHAGGRVIGLDTISSQLSDLPKEMGQPVAALNGDFYAVNSGSYQGDPRGLQIMRGEYLSAPTGDTAFWMDPQGMPRAAQVFSQLTVVLPNGQTNKVGLNEDRPANGSVLYTPRLGGSTLTSGGREMVLEHSGKGPWLPLSIGQTYQARIRSTSRSGNSRIPNDAMVLSIGAIPSSTLPAFTNGSLVTISAATVPDLSGVQTALGGGPVLVRDGKAVPTQISKSGEKHPRSAIGWNDQYLFLVAADGRQEGYSIGATLAEMSAFLVRLGCKQANNMDGGGSTELMMMNGIVNRPSTHAERQIANAFVVLRKPPEATRDAAK